MIRLVTFHVYSGWLMSPISLLWDKISDRIMEIIPRRFQHIMSGVLVGIIIVAGAMTSQEFEDNTRVNRIVSLAGYALCIALLWATSRNRRMVNWRTVIVGILLQFAIGIFVLRTSAGFNIFSWISRMCRQFLGFADSGLIFITDATVPTLPWLAISVVPPIIFFAGIAQLLSYWYDYHDTQVQVD
jgi:CNT family concentrative nucleoside transporter